MVCFFFNDTTATEIYTLSLHDALPILDRVLQEVADGEGDDQQRRRRGAAGEAEDGAVHDQRREHDDGEDRKSTRLNSSHANISHAVFCLKNKQHATTTRPASANSPPPP